MAARLDLTPDDATLCPTPLAQPFHLEASILPALLRGATAGLLKSWQPDDAWEQMERNGTTVLCGTPEHCEQLLEASAARGRKPASLRAARHDGNHPGHRRSRRPPPHRTRTYTCWCSPPSADGVPKRRRLPLMALPLGRWRR